ncbi:MAG: DUF4190 domain-containing protein [Candidatus Staskawiczbacteria bacterium]|nr:DUF4190 domain-containing protein [Candidatus Staskawiczbacteria bacterium]
MEQNINKSQKTSKLAVATLVLGILSIPLFFFKLGIIAVILGVISLFRLKNPLLKGKWFAIVGILCGIMGMILVLIPFSTFFNFAFNPNNFTAQKSEVSQKILDDNVKLIDTYKSKYGKYPQTLGELTTLSSTPIFTFDHYLKPFYYKASADGLSYELRSLGPDGECGTDDDILPTGSRSPKIITCQIEKPVEKTNTYKFNPTGIIATINTELRNAKGYNGYMAVMKKYDSTLQPYYQQTSDILQSDFQAVNGYHTKFGKYPETLDEVANAGIKVILTDAFGGSIVYYYAPLTKPTESWGLESRGPSGDFGGLGGMSILFYYIGFVVK